MIKKVTLSLVATMLAGMTLVASSAPALACDNNNNNLRGFNGNGRYNAIAAQNYLYNNQLNNGFNGLNSGFNNKALKQARKMQHRQRQAQRRLMKQQYAAVNGNNGYNIVNNPYVNPGLANAYLNSGGACSNGLNNNTNGLYNNGLYNNGLYNNSLYNNAGLYGNPVNGFGVSSLLGRVLNRL